MVRTQVAAHNRRSHIGKVEEFLRSVAQFLEQPLSRLDAQNEKSERQLKAQSPSNSLQANVPATRGKKVGETQDRENAEHSCEPSHAFLLCAWLTRRPADGKPPPQKRISGRTFLPARSGSQDAPNKGALFRGRFLGEEIVLSDQRLRFGEPRIGIVADGGERLAFLNAIADALVKLQTDSVIDGVFLFLATTAKNGKRNAESLAVGAGYVARGRAGHVRMKTRLGQSKWFIDDAVVTALQADALLEFFLGLSACDHPLGQVAALFDAFGAFAKVEHPGRELQTQFAKISGAAAAQDLHALGDFVGVASGTAERLVHIGDGV